MCSVTEFDIKFITQNNQTTKWKKNIYNEKLTINRGIICAALAAVKADLSTSEVRCLDGTGGCGIYSLLWLKYLNENINVTVSDKHSEAVEIIKQNHESLGVTCAEVLNVDPCVLLREKTFDFVFLNCDTSTSQSLDSAFFSLQENKVLAVTTCEDPSLYWQAPDVALRCYGGVVGKNAYHKEFAVRLVIAEMARAAARYNKRLKVLCVAAFKPHQAFTIIVTVSKGAKEATDSLQLVKRLLHCSLCEEKVFVPKTQFVVESLSQLLPCTCRSLNDSQTVLEFGPVWSGDIFCPTFIKAMLTSCKGTPWDKNVSSLLTTILAEAVCGKDNIEEPPYKKAKLGIVNNSPMSPCFYINTHRHSPKDQHLLKVTKIISVLKNSGFRASKTHFDPEAVRTDASVAKLMEIIKLHS